MTTTELSQWPSSSLDYVPLNGSGEASMFLRILTMSKSMFVEMARLIYPLREAGPFFYATCCHRALYLATASLGL